jgi:succinyl-diaminopimelate desuccinylase
VLVGHEVASEAGGLRTGKPGADAHSFGRVTPLGDGCPEVVERCEGLAIRVRNEQPNVLEAIRKKLGHSLLEGVQAFPGSCRDEECTRIGVLDPAAGEHVERVDLVQYELHRDVVGSDPGENATDRGDRLGQSLFGQRRVGDVENEIGDERLLERCGESLDQLRGQSPDEADGVGHEIALPVVVESAGRRVERLEQAVVHGRICTGQSVEERRLPDVRVPRERDRRRARPHALLAPRRALALQGAEALLQERHARPGEASVGLELALTRPSRPDPAAEPLQVLPHAAHARQVVLELRQLDLELAVGARRVLGEDVENELRPVDDARLQHVLERALLGRAQLVVDEQRLRLGVSEDLLELGQLSLADERSRVRMGPVLDDLADGQDAGRACELAELSELVLRARALRVDAEEKRTLRLRPGCGIGLARSHREIMPRYAPAVTALADRLAARTLELVDIPSQSGHEAAIRDHVLGLMPAGWVAEYAGDEAFLYVGPRRAGFPLIVLAAHYDTVPAQGNVPGWIADGEVHGLGASDMKGGLAVALELARGLDLATTTSDLALLVFGREELPTEHNPLPALFDASSAIQETTLAIVLEPTDLELQSGCLGNVVARLTFHGTSGHSARPWLADSALERAVHGLGPLLEHEPRVAVVGGLEFREVVAVTRLEAGIADNVIPGEATATLNLRYPPDREPADAEAYLASLVPEAATLEVVSNAAPARVVTDAPAVRVLRAAGELVIRPKQAWTNVADFTVRGLDAVNFGPGHTALAHHAEERVAISSLIRAYDVLERFLTTAIGEDAA